MIREANTKDKIRVLQFCKDTFSWGDYIDQVWDSWLSEGNLFLCESQFPIGICHAFYSKDQIWIEGIRVDPNFRRQKIASELIKHAESIGKENSISFSYMLIDTLNTNSLSMANSLNYSIFQTWNFYSLDPKSNSNYAVDFEKSLDCKLYTHYVKSWRWLPLDDELLSLFSHQNKIITSSVDGNTSHAIITESEHFDKTMIVTLFSDHNVAAIQILSFLQNYALDENYKRIQILTIDDLPKFDTLEHKISFHLMKKHLL
ncbi:MAG: GNAT family N-acetyltransferase [Nitrosopumilus sp.]|nr:GNAT family N-acetyltransferase [Nitrosopumilus sp.]MDH5658957.1 GNAT family N-acetyltransferase [Nitrosopumilus sp.]